MGVSNQFIARTYVSDPTSSRVRPVALEPSEVLITLLLPASPDVGSMLFQTLFPSPPPPTLPSSSAPLPPSFPSLPATLTTALRLIHRLLAISGNSPSTQYPPITIVVSTTTQGVAETTASTITLASSYVEAQIRKDEASVEEARREIEGVLCHEMVHIVQEDGQASAPGWWIEGVADWVRLEGGLGARHWKKLGQGNHWTDAYETTALFLSHLTTHVHPNLVAAVNARLKSSPWSDSWFEDLTAKSIDTLWREYKAFYAETIEGAQIPKAVPTHLARP